MTRAIVALVLVMASCTGSAPPPAATAPATAPAGAATPAAPTTPASAAKQSPAATPAAAAYLSMPLTDVRTGERFTVGGFPGKVTIVQAMAVW